MNADIYTKAVALRRNITRALARLGEERAKFADIPAVAVPIGHAIECITEARNLLEQARTEEAANLMRTSGQWLARAEKNARGAGF